MPVSEPAIDAAESGTEERFPGFTHESVEQWCAICTKFLQWERERILLADPSPAEQAKHRQTLTWLLRLTRLMHSITADPEFPEPKATELLEMKIWQLTESWKSIYEPLSRQGAAAVLTRIFPGES